MHSIMLKPGLQCRENLIYIQCIYSIPLHCTFIEYHW